MSDWRSIASAARRAATLYDRDRRAGEEEFGQLLGRYPGDAMLLFQRGKARAEVGDLAGARGDLTEAARRFPVATWREQALSVLAALGDAQGRPLPRRGRPVTPPPDQLLLAHHVFVANEPRGVDFEVASRLLSQAIEMADRLSATVPTAMLLQSWNFAYYQHGRVFDADHYARIDGALSQSKPDLIRFRDRSIETMTVEDRASVQSLFSALAKVVGRVGAPKVLHLWAPGFFPIWDNPIAAGYGFDLSDPVGQYWSFMLTVREQLNGMVVPDGLTPLKALDEYNYCRFSKGWISA